MLLKMAMATLLVVSTVVFFLQGTMAQGVPSSANSAIQQPVQPPAQQPPSVTARQHPVDWVHHHGKKYVEYPALCQACHGSDLSGGMAGIMCNLCHLKPNHPPDWKDIHGQEYIKDKKQCVLCHGGQPFSGEKRPWAMNCTRCHSVGRNIARFQNESHTSSVNFNISQNVQAMEDRFGHKGFESNHYLGFHVSEASQQISSSTQLRIARNWIDEKTNFDLFESYVEVENLFKNKLDLMVGRQGFGSNMDYFLLDGINVLFKPNPFFDVSLYAGVPRYIDLDDIGGETGFASGISLLLREIHHTKARLDLHYMKQNLFDTLDSNTDKIYLGASLSKGISIFRFYGLGEYDVFENQPNTISVGAEIYPFVKKIGFLLEGSFFNESRDDELETIFKIFSAGALWQARAGVFFDVIEDLHLFSNFSLQRYDVLDGATRNGYNLKSGIGYDFENIRLESEAYHYFVKSYGGTVNGVVLSLYEEWISKFYTRLILDYLIYTKVNNDDNNAFNVILSNGFQLKPYLFLSATAEYANNDVMENELRAWFSFDYFFHRKFLDEGDRKEMTPAQQGGLSK